MDDTSGEIDPFTPRRRRRSRRGAAREGRRKLATLAALLIGVPAVCLLAFWFTEPPRDPPTASAASADPRVQPSTEPGRPVYRYSIVGGGVTDAAAVRAAIARDEIIAEHYEAVDVSKLHVETLTAPLEAYVSYRIGDSIFWTRNPQTLQPGELILTDGLHTIRGRSGSRVATNPLPPVLDFEPAPDEFEHVVATAAAPPTTADAPDGATAGAAPADPNAAAPTTTSPAAHAASPTGSPAPGATTSPLPIAPAPPAKGQ